MTRVGQRNAPRLSRILDTLYYVIEMLRAALNGIIDPSHGLIDYRCWIMVIGHRVVRHGGVRYGRQWQRIGRIMIVLSKNWFGLVYHVRLFDDRHFRRRHVYFGQNNRRYDSVRGRTACSCDQENGEYLRTVKMHDFNIRTL